MIRRIDMKILCIGSFFFTLVLCVITYSGHYEIVDSIIMVLFWNALLFALSLDNRYLEMDLSEIKLAITTLRFGLGWFVISIGCHYLSLIMSIL